MSVNERKDFEELELVRFDPDDPDTFPSICPTPQDVERRFGFKGGELLAFTTQGAYVGVVRKGLLA